MTVAHSGTDIEYSGFGADMHMSEVLQFRRKEANRFGSCPECGNRSGILNLGTLRSFREVVPLPWRWQVPERDARSPVSES
jgi:hypothetical protein